MASTGPTEQSATKPKLFSCALRPPILRAIPTPSAMINGTVIGPVVTPPESNASARKGVLDRSKSSATMAKIIK